jgi:hypothetical protein
MTNNEEFGNQQLGSGADGGERARERGDVMSAPKMAKPTLRERILLEGGPIAELIKIEDEKANGGRRSEQSSLPTKEGGQQETKVCGSANLDDGTTIGALAKFVQRFVFLKDATYYTLVAAWIVATYLYKKFEYMGYLFVYSPERRSGKSTLLELLNLLVYQPTGLQVSPTEAVMFRTAEGHTHLLDEVDSWRSKDDLRDVLNAGYKKGGIVARCDKGKGGSFKPTSFPVFAPRALAGIGISILHPTTLDRTFALPMVRQKKEEKRERSRERKIGPEAKKLRLEVESWVKKNENTVAEIYDRAEFPCLEPFGDRTIDIAEPLVAIVQAAYQGHPEEERAMRELVHAIASTRREQQSASPDHLLLKHLLALAENEDPLVGNASELAAQCGNLETPIEQYTVSRVLRKYGFKSKPIRKDGQKPLYRYSLTHAELKEVVERWASDAESQPLTADGSGKTEEGSPAC